MSTSDIIVLIILPILAFFGILVIIWILYKRCTRKNGESKQLLMDNSDDTRAYFSNSTNDNTQYYDRIIKEEIGLIDLVKHENNSRISEIRESAFMYLQFFLRSNSEKGYEILDHLPCLGSRLEKNWFLLKQTYNDADKNKKIILKLVSLYKIDMKNTKSINLSMNSASMPVNKHSLIVTNQQAKLLNELFISLSHPYLLKYDFVDVNFDQSYSLFVSGYSKDGSLKDKIYSSKPINDWLKKYQLKSKGLSLSQIKEYAKQIVSALLYLQYRQLPPITNLHSGNIIMANYSQDCLLSGYEHAFLGLEGRLSYLFNQNIKKLSKYKIISNDESLKYDLIDYVKEVFAYGHLIYEMCAGCELDKLTPLPKHFQRIQSLYNSYESSQLISFLNFIFFHNKNGNMESSKNDSNEYFLPSIDLIGTHNFLTDIKIKPITNSEYNSISQSIEMLNFIDYISQKYHQIKEITKSKKDLTKKKGNDPWTNQKHQKLSSISPQMSTSPAPAPPPPPPPPPPFPSLQPQSNSNDTPELNTQHHSNSDRQTLLVDIRKGKQLKKVVTVDKSKPKLK